MKRFVALCLVALFATFCASQIQAADKKPAPAEKGEKKPRALPFHGKIDSVNHVARTIKVGERTFYFSPTTKFVKGGKPASIDDAKVGEEVGGSYHEGDEGKLQLNSLRIGPKPENPQKEK